MGPTALGMTGRGLVVVAAWSVGASACTIGVANGSATPDDRPLLWKSRMWSGSPNNQLYFASGPQYHYLGVRSIGGSTPMMGLNEAGLCTGNSLVGDGENGVFMRHILGNYATVDQVEAYIQQQFDAGTLNAAGCFPFIDATGDAVMFEVDHSTLLLKYDSMDPDRAVQDMLGWVVRANEFHNRPDGTDDVTIGGRYYSGAYNTHGLVVEDLLAARTIMQGNNGAAGYEFMRYGPGRTLTTIAQPSVCSSMVVQGVLPEEDPALSTMWVLLGQANYGIAVPTWVSVSDLPDCLNDGNMAARANALYAKGQEVRTQASVFPLEAHLFDEVDELLTHWRSLGVSAAEMARVEHVMTDDAYSLLYCLDFVRNNNRAPTVVLDDVTTPGLTVDFSAVWSDADGSVSSWEWDFGDGGISTEPAPRHTYAAPGWYLVSCTVTDDNGVSNTDWEYVHVLSALRLTIVNSTWGSVLVDPNLPGYDDANTVVTLTAVPIEGKAFRQWEIYDPNHPDDTNYVVLDANNPLRIVMDSDRQVAAVFKCGSGVDQFLPLLLAGAAFLSSPFGRTRRRHRLRGA